VRVASLARSTEWSLRIKPVYITLHLHAHQGRICILIDPFSLPSPAPRSPDVALEGGMVGQKSRRNSGFLPPLAADRVYDHNGAVPSTVRHAGRPQDRPAREVSAGLLSEKKRPNPALADLAVLAGPWLLLRSRKSVLVRLTRPGCRSSSCQAFCCATEGVSTWRWRERWPG